MRPHHTKDKGDVGVAHAIADLADQGFVVLTALCEHAPFDLVAYRDGTFARVQAKYRTLASNGALKVNFVSSWSDSRGTYHRPIDKREVDVVCIYCPDTGACYYVDPKAFGISVSLRVRPSGTAKHATCSSPTTTELFLPQWESARWAPCRVSRRSRNRGVMRRMQFTEEHNLFREK